MNKLKAALWFAGATAVTGFTYVVSYYFGGLVAEKVIVPMVMKGMGCLEPKEAEEEQEDPKETTEPMSIDIDKWLNELKGA